MVKLPKELLFVKGKQFAKENWRVQKIKNYNCHIIFLKLSRSERSVQNTSILGILGVGK